MATNDTDTSQQPEPTPPLPELTFDPYSPSPAGLPAAETKRCLPSDTDTDSDEDSSPPSPPKKARTTTPPLKKPNITEENVLLLELKDEKSMKWPEIVEEFRQRGWGRKTGLLKNRYRSLKEGTVFWEDDDVDIMHQAIFQVEQEYEKTKWDHVAEKMVELGSSRKFTGAACEKKFRAKAESRKKGFGEEKSVSETTSD